MERALVLFGWLDAIGTTFLLFARAAGWIAWSWTTTLAPLWAPFAVWTACCAMALLGAWAEFALVRLWRRDG